MRDLIHRGPILLLGLLAAAAPGAAEELWLHVDVEEGDGARVSVNLPLALAETALALVLAEQLEGARLLLDESDWTVAELRALWRQVAASPDATFVTVEDGDERVRVWKEAGYLRVEASEDDDGTVDVRMPAAVVDALLSGDDERLDLGAAMTALAAHGEGESVTVNDDSDRVRVWVDRVAETR